MGQYNFNSQRSATVPLVVGLLAMAGTTIAQVSSNNCTKCFIQPIPLGGMTIGWKPVDITAVTVATATVVIDTVAGLTSTKTGLATITADSDGNKILDDEALAKFWSSQVTPAGVLKELTVINGKPTATVTTAMVRGANAESVVSGTIAWPTKYEHQGFAASSWLADTCVNPTKTLAVETLPLTPTITNAMYTNAFDYPLDFSEWSDLLPPNNCNVQQVAGTATGLVLTQARAVTDTVTSYGVVVNRQEPTPKPDANSAQSSAGRKDDDKPASSQSGSGSSAGTGGGNQAGSSPSQGSGSDEAVSRSSPAASPSEYTGAASGGSTGLSHSGLLLSMSAGITILMGAMLL